MNQVSQAIRVGLFFIVGAVLTWIAYETLSERGLSTADSYQVDAAFKNLRQLKTSDEVRMAGVRIGQVAATDLRDHRAVAVLSIDRGYTIPEDSVATISTAGLLGVNYVAIAPGDASGNLSDGANVDTVDTPDLNEVIADVGKLGERMDRMFERLEGAFAGLVDEDGVSPGELIRNLNELVVDNRERIDGTLGNLDALSTQIASGEGTLGKLIFDDAIYKDVRELTVDLRSAASNANGLVADMQGLMGDIKEGKGMLGAVLYDPGLADDFRATIGNVEAFSVRLNAPDSSLGRFLADDTLYVQAQETLKKVETAASSIEDSGPITAVGVLASALF